MYRRHGYRLLSSGRSVRGASAVGRRGAAAAAAPPPARPEAPEEDRFWYIPPTARGIGGGESPRLRDGETGGGGPNSPAAAAAPLPNSENGWMPPAAPLPNSENGWMPPGGGGSNGMAGSGVDQP